MTVSLAEATAAARRIQAGMLPHAGDLDLLAGFVLAGDTERLRTALRVYVAEVKRAAEWLASMPDDEQGYDPSVVSALGYMGDLDPGHDEDSEVAQAIATIRAALAEGSP